MPRCAVPGCKKRYTSTHYFPKDTNRCREWVKFVQKYKPDFSLTPWSSLCGSHFEMQCFNYNFEIEEKLGCKSIRRNLTEDAVPTIFDSELELIKYELPDVMPTPSSTPQSSPFTYISPSSKIVAQRTPPSTVTVSSLKEPTRKIKNTFTVSLPLKKGSSLHFMKALATKPKLTVKIPQKTVTTAKSVKIVADEKNAPSIVPISQAGVASSKDSVPPFVLRPKLITAATTVSSVPSPAPAPSFVRKAADTAPLSQDPKVVRRMLAAKKILPKTDNVNLTLPNRSSSYTLQEMKCMESDQLIRLFSVEVNVADAAHTALRCKVGEKCPFVISCPSERDCKSVMQVHLKKHIDWFIKLAEENALPQNRVLINMQVRGEFQSVKVHDNSSGICRKIVPTNANFIQTLNQGDKQPTKIEKRAVPTNISFMQTLNRGDKQLMQIEKHAAPPEVKLLTERVRTLPIPKEKANELCARIEALGRQIFPQHETGVVPNDSLERAFMQLKETIVSRTNKVKFAAPENPTHKSNDYCQTVTSPRRSLMPESKRKVTIDPNLSQSLRTMDLVLSPLARFSKPPSNLSSCNLSKAENSTIPIITNVCGSVPRHEAGSRNPKSGTWSSIDPNSPNILGKVNSILKSYRSVVPSPKEALTSCVANEMILMPGIFSNTCKETQEGVSRKQSPDSVQNRESSPLTATIDDFPVPLQGSKDFETHDLYTPRDSHFVVHPADKELPQFFDDCDFDIQQNVELPAEECEPDVPEIPLNNSFLDSGGDQLGQYCSEASTGKCLNLEPGVASVNSTMSLCRKKVEFLRRLGLQTIDAAKISEVVSNVVPAPKFRTRMQKKVAVLQRLYHKRHAAMAPKQLTVKLQPIEIDHKMKNSQSVTLLDKNRRERKVSSRSEYSDIKGYHLRRANLLTKRAHKQKKLLALAKVSSNSEKFVPDKGRIVRMPEDGMLEMYKAELRMVKKLEEQEVERRRRKRERIERRKNCEREEVERKRLEEERKAWEEKDHISVDQLLPPGKRIFQRQAQTLPMRTLNSPDKKSQKHLQIAEREISVDGKMMKIKQEPLSDGEEDWMNEELRSAHSSGQRRLSEEEEEPETKKPKLTVSHLLFQRRKRIKKPSHVLNMLAPPDLDDNFFNNIFDENGSDGAESDSTDSEKSEKSEDESTESIEEEEEVDSDTTEESSEQPFNTVQAMLNMERSKQRDELTVGAANAYFDALKTECLSGNLTVYKQKTRVKALQYLKRLKVVEMKRAEQLLTGGSVNEIREFLRCKICSRLFTTITSITFHYRGHAGLKPYKCESCPRSFTRLNSLRYHQMVHDDTTRYTCQFCSKGFRHTSHYKEHLNMHTGDEPFKCRECVGRFKNSNSLRRHLRAVHGLKTRVAIAEHMPGNGQSKVKLSSTPGSVLSASPSRSESLSADVLTSRGSPRLLSWSPPLPDSPPVPASVNSRLSPPIPTPVNSRLSPPIPTFVNSRLSSLVPTSVNSGLSPPIPTSANSGLSPPIPTSANSRLSPPVPTSVNSRPSDFLRLKPITLTLFPKNGISRVRIVDNRK